MIIDRKIKYFGVATAAVMLWLALMTTIIAYNAMPSWQKCRQIGYNYLKDYIVMLDVNPQYQYRANNMIAIKGSHIYTSGERFEINAIVPISKIDVIIP